MSEPTIEQIERDLCFSHRDMNCLMRVIDGLTAFIQCGDECGENREAFRCDVLRFQILLQEAKRIHATIEKKEAEVISRTNKRED